MDDSVPDKYIPRWRSNMIAELDERFAVLCDRDICTAMLLGKLYWFSRTAKEASEGMDDDYHDPAIYNTIEGIATWFLSLFEVTQIGEALKYLVSREYITVWQSFGSNSLKIECNLGKVDEAKRSLKPTRRLIHSWEHSVEVARKEAERQEDWRIVTVAEAAKIDATAEEARKVKYHNSRAKNAGLPATLTVEQWIATLNYFEWKCAYCGGKYSLLEHFIPLSHGHGTTWSNCVPACGSCNTTKQAWHPLEDWGPNMLHLQMGINRVQAYLATRERNP